MDTKKYVIIIKGKISTSEIEFCRYNNYTRKWDVKFNGGKVYSYNYSSVKYLKNPVLKNPKEFQISKGGRELREIKAIYVFLGNDTEYWHICYSNGQEETYLKEELNIVESCLNEKQSKCVLDYLKQIAGLNELKNEETKEVLLAKKFSKLDFIGKDVALAKYLNPDSLSLTKQSKEYVPIFPFGCNNSQYNAVKNAMENQISVIQGPPGTGKTQTILNIISNILIQGKNVQVVSNNNSATENVYEKLSSSKYGLGFLVASLGKSKNKVTFVKEQNGVYPDFSFWKSDDELASSLKSVQEKSLELKKVFDKREELAKLKQELTQLTTEIRYFEQYLEETDVNPDLLRVKKNLNAKSWMTIWQECLLIADEKKKIGLLFKIKSFFQYGLINFKFYKQDIGKIITSFQAMFYRKREQEVIDSIKEIEKDINSREKDLLENMCEQSKGILRNVLANRYKGKSNREIFSEDDLWKRSQEVLKEYPVILSTTFSSKNSLNSKIIYDYLIIDEASQVDVATGALALSCAKNVVIVGDTKQLPNVITKEMEMQSDAIFNSYHIHEGYSLKKSFLQSILDVMPNVPQTLLREHYRCHPKIINFCNQKFYRGELIIMTEDHNEKDVLAAIKTVPGNHVREHYSQRQIDVIKHEIIPKYIIDTQETGIITPYKNQVEAIQREIPEIDVATVHKFQGKEKDTIIISTVDDEITDFADDPYLINVAVSRAKKKLMLVISGNDLPKERNLADLVAYIQYNNFEVVQSKIYSIFDYLYKQYTEERKKFLEKHKMVSEYDSENLMHALLEEILSLNEYASLDAVCHFPMNMLIKNPELLDDKECKYAMNPATHLDFLIYNRISKNPVLAIEVDGYEYHKDNTEQAERDLMKDNIMKKYEIPIYRFKTNGSGEKEKILEKLSQFV